MQFDRPTTLYTENGVKELDPDVSEYIQALHTELQNVTNERNTLKLKVFELEFKLNRGWFKTLIDKIINKQD